MAVQLYQSALTLFIEQQIAQRLNSRVFSLVYRGEKIWIKQAEKTKYTKWHQLSKIVAVLIHNPLFYPTVNLDGVRVVKEEAERLRFLYMQGVPVPKVLAEGENWIAVSDAGQSVAELVNSDYLSMEAKKKIVCKASAQLAKLHQHNKWHGRPVLRDMAWDGEQITFIDLEENPGKILTAEQCMIRDVLIYVQSLFRDLQNRDLIFSAVTCYKEHGPETIWRAVKNQADSMNVFYMLLRILYRFIGKDGKSSYHALHELRNWR